MVLWLRPGFNLVQRLVVWLDLEFGSVVVSKFLFLRLRLGFNWIQGLVVWLDLGLQFCGWMKEFGFVVLSTVWFFGCLWGFGCLVGSRVWLFGWI